MRARSVIVGAALAVAAGALVAVAVREWGRVKVRIQDEAFDETLAALRDAEETEVRARVRQAGTLLPITDYWPITSALTEAEVHDIAEDEWTALIAEREARSIETEWVAAAEEWSE